VHDQTVRLMNRGLYPEEIVTMINLPPHLATHPYLQEFYGTIEWSVRGVYDGYLGWFGGRAADLNPEPPLKRAQRLVQLAGGREQLLATATSAIAGGEAQWALELAEALLDTDPARIALGYSRAHIGTGSLDGIGKQARVIKASALSLLASKMPSANGRNYLLTAIQEEEGLVIETHPEQKSNVLARTDIPGLFKILTVVLDGPAASTIDQALTFQFIDLPADHPHHTYSIHVRKGIADAQAGAPKLRAADLTVKVDSNVWRSLMARTRSPAATFIAGDIVVEGKGIAGAPALSAFLGMFRDPTQK